MNLQDIKDKIAKKEWVNPDDFIEALKPEVETARFLIGLHPIQAFVGGIGVADGNTTDQVICKVDETRYKLKENYKISFIPEQVSPYGYEHFYISDFVSMLRSGIFKILS